MSSSTTRFSSGFSTGALAAGLMVMAVLIAGPLGLDAVIRDALRAQQSPGLVDLFGWVTHLGEGWLLGLVAAVLAAIGYRGGFSTLVRPSLLSIPALIVSGLVTRVFKIGFGRPRPGIVDQGLVEWTPSLAMSGWHSFPSGHATSAFTVAVIFGLYFPGWRVALYGCAALIAVSRVVVGAHFFSDVVGGAAVGWLVGWGAVVWVERRRPSHPRTR